VRQHPASLGFTLAAHPEVSRDRPHICLVAASKTTMLLSDLLSNPTDRLVGLIALMMFFAGIVLACREVVRWRKARKGAVRFTRVHTRIIGYRCGPSSHSRIPQHSLHKLRP